MPFGREGPRLRNMSDLFLCSHECIIVYSDLNFFTK